MRAFVLVLMLGMAGLPAAAQGFRFATLQSDPSRAGQTADAGCQLATLGLSWDRLEPSPGKFDQAYLAAAVQDIRTFARAGQRVVLDLGWQYPPAWVWSLPNSRFVNQHGEAYAEPKVPGSNGANAVFNQVVRDRQAAYLERVLKELKPVLPHVEALRLGGCYYGELQYPPHQFGQGNSYWAFDPVALGQDRQGDAADGELPPGVPPNPVPGWRPGQPSPDGEAARFLDWYLDALAEYQAWQILTARRHFEGSLVVLYPGAGLRSGQAEAAVAQNLDGSTGAEKTGELPGGRDFARWLRAIPDDGRVVVCTTWLDAHWPGQDDQSDNQLAWSPVRLLTHLCGEAKRHPPLWGENTDHSSREDLVRSVDRMREYNVRVLMWAFEIRLFQPSRNHASLADLRKAIQALNASPNP